MATTPRRTFLKLTGMGGVSLVADMAAGREVRAQEPARTAVATVQTPILSIAYEDTGDPRGFPVILLHGFPDDVRAFDEVVPPLTKAGYRALVPYIRGYGPTTFRDSSAPRMAEQAAIGQDVIDFADALRLPRFAVAGYDWGGRAAAIAAALHPDRVRATVLIGGYTVQNTVAPQPPAVPEAEHRIWYQVLLQHRARARGAHSQSPRDLPLPLAAVVTGLAFHRRDIQPHGRLVRQPGLRRRRDSLVPPSHRKRAGRAAIQGRGGTTRDATQDSGAVDHVVWRRRRDRPPACRIATRRAGRVRTADRSPGRRRRGALHAARAPRCGVVRAAGAADVKPVTSAPADT